MDVEKFAELVRQNSGVCTRRELETLGISAETIARRIASGEWQRPFRGVFFLFPGIPTPEQRVLCVQKWTAGRGVFSHGTAAYLNGMRRTLPNVLEVVVETSRGLRSTAKCVVRRTRGPVIGVGDPPRTSIEQTVLDLAAGAETEADTLEILTAGVRAGMKIPRLLDVLSRRARVRHREFVQRLVAIVEEGVESPLEHEYRRRVERPHGLPRSVCQRWELVRGRWIRSDRWYKEFRVRAELDGELAHPGRATDEDVLRDNDVVVSLGEITLRYRWAHVWNMPCVAAAQVAAGLRAGGWPGSPTRCSPECRAPEIAAELARHAA